MGHPGMRLSGMSGSFVPSYPQGLSFSLFGFRTFYARTSHPAMMRKPNKKRFPAQNEWSH